MLVHRLRRVSHANHVALARSAPHDQGISQDHRRGRRDERRSVHDHQNRLRGSVTHYSGAGSRDLSAFFDLLFELEPEWLELWVRCEREYRDVAPWIVLRTMARDLPDTDPDFRAVLDVLEYQIGGDASVDELILGAFLTELGPPSEFARRWGPRLGPGLRAALDQRIRGEVKRTGWAYTGFVSALAVENTAAGEVLRQHIADWEELIPHGFMADLVRAAIVWLATPGGRADVSSLLATLEDAYGNDSEVEELIATGFVENLPYPDEDGAELLTLLGPKLRAEYNAQRTSHQI